MSLVRAYPPVRIPEEPAYWFLFARSSLIVREDQGRPAVPVGVREGLGPLVLRREILLGTFRGRPVIAAQVEQPQPASGFECYPLAQAGMLLEPELFSVAGYAFQLLRWQRKSRFCSSCGEPTEAVEGEWGRRCPACRHLVYPPVSPCVIVLVHDGDRILLTHKRDYGPMHGLVAGFVEPGESLEECLHREVAEEVGVAVDGIEYVGSQPWPFPHQIMVGFYARYAGGDIVIDETELDGAGWFAVDALPPIPPRLSIARKLIDGWVGRRR